MYKRIILKLSGEALAGGKGGGFCDNAVEGIIDQVSEITRRGVQTGLVVGGGNFWRGRSGAGWLDRVKSDQMGMIATVMNGIYLSECFRARGIKAVVMTPMVLSNIAELFSKDKAIEYLEEGAVLIFAGGTGHPFFSTDTIAAIRGAELGACALLFFLYIDGVYSGDPRTDKGARKYKHITYRQVLSENLRVVDLAVCGLCIETGLTGIVFGLNEPGGLLSAVSGNDEEIFRIGTKVTI